jgi:UDP-GlcNAc:undecaprenyl-phosphate GlcNAc-1-phosphate transferase
MGNAGSHFLGFILAATALSVHYANLETKLALSAPVLILGLPIFDILFVILMRIRNGRSAFNKSNDHLALRLLKAGYSKKSALVFMATLALIFASCGLAIVGLQGLNALFPLTLALIIGIATAKKLSAIRVDG